MPDSPKIPLSSTSQQHLDIETVAQDMVILKDGSACFVLEVSALNFGLLSEKEQDATIFAYGQLLNSLNFSIQIVVSSKQKDISDYIKLLDSRFSQMPDSLLRKQLSNYRDFVKAVVRQGNVLDKKFYVAIPFSSLELGVASALFTLNPKSKGLPRPLIDIVDRAATNLSPKRDHLVRMFARIGLRARQLTSNDLLQLFFNYYNRDHVSARVKLPL